MVLVWTTKTFQIGVVLAHPVIPILIVILWYPVTQLLAKTVPHALTVETFLRTHATAHSATRAMIATHIFHVAQVLAKTAAPAKTVSTFQPILALVRPLLPEPSASFQSLVNLHLPTVETPVRTEEFVRTTRTGWVKAVSAPPAFSELIAIMWCHVPHRRVRTAEFVWTILITLLILALALTDTQTTSAKPRYRVMPTSISVKMVQVARIQRISCPTRALA
jgi:hypothetical protein